MKRIATIAATLLLSLGLFTTPANADSRPGVTPTSRCVTPSEFYSIDKGGRTRAEAEKILDWEGATASSKPNVHTWGRRLYRGCNGPWSKSVVHVVYRKGVVDYAAWLILF